MTRSGSDGPAQLRRARAGRLTEAGLTLFLRTLAASRWRSTPTLNA